MRTIITNPLWTREQDKAFERALVMFPEGAADRWARIAAEVAGKSAADARAHFDELVQDVTDIDSGRVEPPRYPEDSAEPVEPQWMDSGEPRPRGQISFGAANRRESERKKGVPWTEIEHRRFLWGLEKYGKGDWRSISRMAVVTRTPTQVASHAQKYFNRVNSGKKEKKRASIHDMTVENSVFGQINEQNLGEPVAPPPHQPMLGHAPAQPDFPGFQGYGLPPA